MIYLEREFKYDFIQQYIKTIDYKLLTIFHQIIFCDKDFLTKKNLMKDF
jgi:hypothetical protein